MGLRLIRYKSPYSTFNEFRAWLFEIVKPETITQDWYGYVREYGNQEHDIPQVPAMPFFWHSDCDGILTTEEIKECLPVLIKAYDNKKKQISQDQCATLQEKNFFDGLLDIILDMSECLAQNKALEFC